MFPGGFGTLDELMEILHTRANPQARAQDPNPPLMARAIGEKSSDSYGMRCYEVISTQDLELFTFADEPGAALAHLQRLLKDIYRARNTRVRALKAHRVSITRRLGRVDEVCICQTTLRAPSLGVRSSVAQQHPTCAGPPDSALGLSCPWETEDLETGQKQNPHLGHLGGYLTYGSDCRMPRYPGQGEPIGSVCSGADRPGEHRALSRIDCLRRQLRDRRV